MEEFSESFMQQYIPILLIFLAAALLVSGMLIVSKLLGRDKPTKTKLMPYECGKDPVGSARERFSVKFYLVAVLFILFDIEAIFLVPWGVVFRTINRTLAYVEMMIFIAVLLVGYLYVLKKGLFEWVR